MHVFHLIAGLTKSINDTILIKFVWPVDQVPHPMAIEFEGSVRDLKAKGLSPESLILAKLSFMNSLLAASKTGQTTHVEAIDLLCIGAGAYGEDCFTSRQILFLTKFMRDGCSECPIDLHCSDCDAVLVYFGFQGVVMTVPRSDPQWMGKTIEDYTWKYAHSIGVPSVVKRINELLLEKGIESVDLRFVGSGSACDEHKVKKDTLISEFRTDIPMTLIINSDNRAGLYARSAIQNALTDMGGITATWLRKSTKIMYYFEGYNSYETEVLWSLSIRVQPFDLDMLHLD